MTKGATILSTDPVSTGTPPPPAKNLANMEKIDNEALISAVKVAPYLYDTSHPDYKDTAIKQTAWETIAKPFNVAAIECQTRWKNLRDRYTRERQRMARGMITYSKWRLFPQLDFLYPFLHQRSRSDYTVSAISNSRLQNKTRVTPPNFSSSGPLNLSNGGSAPSMVTTAGGSTGTAGSPGSIDDTDLDQPISDDDDDVTNKVKQEMSTATVTTANQNKRPPSVPQPAMVQPAVTQAPTVPTVPTPTVPKRARIYPPAVSSVMPTGTQTTKSTSVLGTITQQQPLPSSTASGTQSSLLSNELDLNAMLALAGLPQSNTYASAFNNISALTSMLGTNATASALTQLLNPTSSSTQPQVSLPSTGTVHHLSGTQMTQPKIVGQQTPSVAKSVVDALLQNGFGRQTPSLTTSQSLTSIFPPKPMTSATSSTTQPNVASPLVSAKTRTDATSASSMSRTGHPSLTSTKPTFEQLMQQTENDEDVHFALSIGYQIRKLNAQQRALAKLRIQQVLYDVQYGLTTGSSETSAATNGIKAEHLLPLLTNGLS